MGKATEALKKRLAALWDDHGAIKNFATESGFSRNSLDNWRSGKASPTLESLEVIAKTLGIEPWDLIMPDDEKYITLSADEKRLIEKLRAIKPISLRAVVHLANGFYEDDVLEKK